MVQLLLDKQADVNAKGIFHCTALHFAIADCQEDIVTMLLTCGADPNAQSYQDANTPLHYAVLTNKAALVDSLVKNKANVNAQNKNKQTPLHLALIHNKQESVSALLKHKPDLNIPDEHRFTPIYYAKKNNITLQ
jgi:ankyrin repeat protein